MAEEPGNCGLNTFNVEGLSRLEIREVILSMEKALSDLPQVEPPLVHHFAPDAYGREIRLPADSLVIGKIHNHAHINVVSLGECTVLTEQGVKNIKAPLTFVSEPGTKRAVYTHPGSDVVWTTIHVTKETDLERIEEYVIAKSYSELDALTVNSTPALSEG